jgi:tripartite-type tricarboxylate transporter receptor subunit TctC
MNKFTRGGCMRKVRWLTAVFGMAIACGLSAQSFPSKPLRLIVPFPAGGTTDIVARLVGIRMSETLGQPVVVENRGGAGGTIGADVVAKAAPDGYTMLMHNVTFPMASVAAAVANRAAYDIETDFAGISIAVFVPLVITAHPGVPARDLGELVKLLQKDKSIRYYYGSTGPGSFMHVMGETLARDAKIEMTHVPLKGAAPLKQELIAGRLQVGGDQLSSSLADIRAGKLRALATNASRRIPELPDVPTVRELGFPAMEADGWNGLFAPARTPREVIERLQKETAAAVRHPETAKRLRELGAEPVGSSPAEQDAILKRQVEQFRPIIREMKIES